MIIGCGIRLEEGVYGERFRIPFEKVYIKDKSGYYNLDSSIDFSSQF